MGVAAALRYNNPADKQSVELQEKIAAKGVRAAVEEITELTDSAVIDTIVAEYEKLA